MKSIVVGLCAAFFLSLVHVSHAGPPGGNGERSGKAGGGFSENGKGGQKGQGGRGGGPPGHAGSGVQGSPPNHGNQGNQAGNPEAMLQQLMLLDANGDQALTPTEVTDSRLHGLLQKADTNSDGKVTFAELATAATGHGARGGGRMGAPNANGGPPRPGEILPGFVQDQLQLNDTQRQQLATLQAQVDAQLLQILTTAQVAQLSAVPQGPPHGGFGQFNGAAQEKNSQAKGPRGSKGARQ